ncbi:MAG: hypothetical protein V7741_09435, partial [Hyphomonas sp.]
MRTKLLASAAIAAICFGGTAFSEEAVVNQNGLNNTASVDQTIDASLTPTGLASNENLATVNQTGDENDATVLQGHTPAGIDNFVIAANSAEVDQTSATGAAVGNVA